MLASSTTAPATNTGAAAGENGSNPTDARAHDALAAEPSAVDLTDEKLELAHRLGADHLVNAAKVDVPQVIQAEGGADVAIVLAATSEVFEQAFRSLRRGGRLVCVGLPKDGAFRLPIFETVLKGISVIGSIVGTRQDLREVFALHAAGRTEVVTEVRDLADVATAMDEVLAGTVPARIVFAFAG